MNDFFEELEKALEQIKKIQPQENWSSDEYRSVLEKIRKAEEAVLRYQIYQEVAPTEADNREEQEPASESDVISTQPEAISTAEKVVEKEEEKEQEDQKVVEKNDTAKEKEQSPSTKIEENEARKFDQIDDSHHSDHEIKERIEKDAKSMDVKDGVELNDRNKAEDNSLASRIQQSPISDLKAAIGLNERFLFANELFDGNMEAFNRALNELNHIDSKEGAYIFINAQLKERFNWNDDSEITVRFLNLVERRFL